MLKPGHLPVELILAPRALLVALEAGGSDSNGPLHTAAVTEAPPQRTGLLLLPVHSASVPTVWQKQQVIGAPFFFNLLHLFRF